MWNLSGAFLTFNMLDLILKALSKIATVANYILYFLSFFREIRLNISCELSAKQMICNISCELSAKQMICM